MFVKFIGVLLAGLVIWAIAAFFFNDAATTEIYTVKPDIVRFGSV